MSNKGSILLLCLFAVSVCMMCLAAGARLRLLQIGMNMERLNGTRCFYLAESGLEISKVKLAHDPGWFTDPSHAEYDKKWLVAGSKGQTFRFGRGGFKVIKEQGKNRVYSVGFIGNSIDESKYFCFLRMDYSVPFKKTGWERF
ncbi:MAG: hypothetical protein WC490_02680 [Candidatus Margulisiibacteriota bacterium]